VVDQRHIHQRLTVLPVSISIENADIGVTYSGVILMNRIIEKSIAMARSLGIRFGSEYSSD
jgi:hypothetical protein